MQQLTFFSAISPTAIIIVVVIVLLLFGGSKIPELARGLAKARKEFKKASDEVESEINGDVASASKPAASAIDTKAIEEEERAKIRARIEAEERAKIAAEKSKDDSVA